MNRTLRIGVLGLILIATLLASAGSASAVVYRSQLCGVDGSDGYADAPGESYGGELCFFENCNYAGWAKMDNLPVCRGGINPEACAVHEAGWCIGPGMLSPWCDVSVGDWCIVSG